MAFIPSREQTLGFSYPVISCTFYFLAEVTMTLSKIGGHIPIPAIEVSDSESTSSGDSTNVFQLSGSCERLSSLWDDEEEKYMEDHLQVTHPYFSHM